jgi:hypothetical protein
MPGPQDRKGGARACPRAVNAPAAAMFAIGTKDLLKRQTSSRVAVRIVAQFTPTLAAEKSQ